MLKDVVIVGGGLSGLTAAWQLNRHGVDVQVLEARNRLGGRVMSIPVGQGNFDLGPSWVWHGQPWIARILNHFNLETYEQFCDGDLLHQAADGHIHRDPSLKPMQHSLRINGGVAAVINALSKTLPEQSISMNSVVQGLKLIDGRIQLQLDSRSEPSELSAQRVALALPLRLASKLSYVPALDANTLQKLQTTSTWMAGHAKFFAFYETPFWRQEGLSGDVLSQRGPLAEIHDASPPSGGPYALFGFVGLNRHARAEMTSEKLVQAAIDQLTDLFGSRAAKTSHVHLQDWSNEPFTASTEDQISPDHHPTYGVNFNLGPEWQDRLNFIVSETAFESGGLIEGAVQQGLTLANQIIKQNHTPESNSNSENSAKPHSASMSWDWFDSKPL